MKYFTFVVLACLCVCGCSSTSSSVGANSGGNSFSAEGFVSISQITVSDVKSGSYSPELKSIFVSGKFMTLLKDANFLSYDKKQQSSIFNASSTTTQEQLVIQVGKNGNLQDVVQQLAVMTSSNKEPVD